MKEKEGAPLSSWIMKQQKAETVCELNGSVIPHFSALFSLPLLPQSTLASLKPHPS